jgi:hypothetical protein
MIVIYDCNSFIKQTTDDAEKKFFMIVTPQELNRGIRREVSRLSERWAILLVRAEDWQRQLDEMLPVK